MKVAQEVRADIFGTQPVYYTVQDGTLYTSDSIFSLLSKVEKRTIDRIALRELLIEDPYSDLKLPRYYITHGRTMFEGIYRLPPAHRLVDHHVEKYFDIFSVNSRPPLLPLLEECVIEALPQTPRVGAYLSGGLDTSTIVALASKHRNVIAFTMAFNHNTDEVEDAALIAKHFNLDHKVLYLSFDAMMKIHDKAILALGRPCGNFYGYPLAELASHHITTLLSGEGSDEIFGSYQNSTRFQAIKHNPYEVQALMNYEIQNKLPYDYLEVDYAMARAFNLDTRVPFCNPKLLGYFNMHWEQKISFHDNINKIQLRKAVKDLLPERILQKEKQGFSFPFETIMKETKDLAEQAMQDPRMKKLLPNTSIRPVPKNPTLYRLGRAVLRSKLIPQSLKTTVRAQHPMQHLLIYSLWRWLDLFDVDVG